MRNNIPTQVKDMLAAEMHAMGLVDSGKVVEAEPLLRRLRDDARNIGIGHAILSHRLSFVCFRQGRLEEALELTCEAIAAEPLNHHYHQGYQAVVQQMREVIEAKSLEPGDARIPRYHALLAREDEATVETHLALLRHLAAVGAKEELERFSKALALLHPGHPEVWRFRAGAGDALPAAADSLIAAGMSLLPTATAKA